MARLLSGQPRNDQRNQNLEAPRAVPQARAPHRDALGFFPQRRQPPPQPVNLQQNYGRRRNPAGVS